jgi:hypothetical protein
MGHRELKITLFEIHFILFLPVLSGRMNHLCAQKMRSFLPQESGLNIVKSLFQVMKTSYLRLCSTNPPTPNSMSVVVSGITEATRKP